MTRKPVRLLIIAGSDSSGGAGIQADIKAATALGAYAMTAVTAVTVQDTCDVHAIHPISSNIVRDQILACLNDIGADTIKIGMLGSAQIVEAVADALRERVHGIPLVVDPVMASSSGTKFLDDDAIRAMKTHLLPLATLITPNVAEAERLTDSRLSSPDAFVQAAQKLFAFGSKAVLFTGGAGDGANVTDVLIESQTGLISVFESPRIDTVHTHGTGCTLATAIAVGLGQILPLVDAVEGARAFVREAIRTAPGFGHGHGPLNHMHGGKD